MSVDFDPYRNWLGIPANEPRPINFYRLCGVELFEPDSDIISLNADKQLDYIRRFSHGPQSEIAESLLTEISKAKLTLLKSERRFDYDLQLRRTLAQPAASNSYAPQPVAPPAAVPQPYGSPQFAPQQYASQPAITQPPFTPPPPPQPHATWQAPQQHPGGVSYPSPVPQPYAAPTSYPYSAPPSNHYPAPSPQPPYPAPGPQSYPAAAPQYSPHALNGYAAPGEAYPSPAMQPGGYQSAAPHEAPAAYQAPPAYGAPTAYQAPGSYQTPAAPEAPGAAEEPVESAQAEDEGTAPNPFNAFGGAPKSPSAAVEIAKPVRKSQTTMWSMIGGLVAVGITMVVLLKSRTDRDGKNTTTPQAKFSSKTVASQPKEPAKKEEKEPLPAPPIGPAERMPLKEIPNAVAKSFQHRITMQGDWSKHLHYSQNVEVHHETDNIKTSYWRPIELNKEGMLIYYFPVDFFIREGTLQTTLVTNMIGPGSPNFDSRAYLHLEVSPDAKQWHRVDGLEPGTFKMDREKKPLDIGKYLLDAKGVYIRARLFSSKIATGGKSTSQFLRAYPNTRAPVFTLSLRGLQQGLEEDPDKTESASPIGKMASIPKRPLPPAYEDVIVEPPQVPTAAELIVKTENENVLKALQEWQTARDSFQNLKARNNAEYLRRFDEEIKQYQSSSVMSAETIKDFVDSLTEDKENFAKTKLYSLAYSMLEHNKVIGSYLTEQKKLENLYETLISRLNSADLAAKAKVYEAMKYHDELLQPLVLCAVSYKKTPTTVPEVLCFCSNFTVNLEPNSKWRIDQKRQIVFNRGDQPNKEYTFKIEPDGRTMREPLGTSVASMQAYFGQLPVLAKPVIKKRVPVQQ
jgi:hypothetical protein